MSKAFKAVEKAAANIGVTDVREDGNVVIVGYNGSTIRIWLNLSVTMSGWDLVVDGNHEGTKRAPSAAFKHAVKVIDARRHAEAEEAAIEAANNAAAAGATILFAAPERITAHYAGHVIEVTLEAEYWAARTKIHADGEFPICASVTCGAALKGAIETVKELIQICGVSNEEVTDITDIAAVRDAINDGFQWGAVDHTNTADDLREFYRIGGEIQDHEILDALTRAVRDEGAPTIIFTLGSDRVEIQVEQSESDADGVATAEDILTDIAGSEARLRRVGSLEEGDGILRAYRVPNGRYEAGDFETVERFGVEIGRYQVQYAEAV